MRQVPVHVGSDNALLVVKTPWGAIHGRPRMGHLSAPVASFSKVRPCLLCDARHPGLSKSLLPTACKACKGTGKTWILGHWLDHVGQGSGVVNLSGVDLDTVVSFNPSDFAMFTCQFRNTLQLSCCYSVPPNCTSQLAVVLPDAPRKVGIVTEDLEVYVPMGSAHGDTILFRGKVR